MKHAWKPIKGELPLKDLSGFKRSEKIKKVTRETIYETEESDIKKISQKYLKGIPDQQLAPFTLEWLLQLHQEMFEHTWEWAGKIRDIKMERGISPSEIIPSIEHALHELRTNKKEGLIYQAIYFQNRMLKILPFTNGNDRWTRLLVNIWLRQHKYGTIKWPEDLGLPGINRTRYIKALKEVDERKPIPLMELYMRDMNYEETLNPYGDDPDEPYVKALLAALKEKHPGTEKDIREEFDFNSGQATRQFSILQLHAQMVLSELREQKRAEKAPAAYFQLEKKMLRLQKILHMTNKITKDDALKKWITKYSQDRGMGGSYSTEDYKMAFEAIQRLFIYTCIFPKIEKKKRGRQEIKGFHVYVAAVIEAYKKISSKKFIFKRPAGAHEPATDGHRFVAAAVTLLNDMILEDGYKYQFSNKNITYACEKARRALNKKRQ